jgi:hypothetical protein
LRVFQFDWPAVQASQVPHSADAFTGVAPDVPFAGGEAPWRHGGRRLLGDGRLGSGMVLGGCPGG